MIFLWGTNNGSTSSENWFNKNGWIITLIISIILVIAFFFVVALIIKEKVKTNKEVAELDSNKYQDCFGGKDNIMEASAKGSRLIVVCKDYSLISDDKLKEAGIDTTIKSTDKITCIVGDQAEAIAESLKKGSPNFRGVREVEK